MSNATQSTVTLLESTRISERYNDTIDTLMIDRPGRLRQFYVVARKSGQPVGDGLVLTQHTALSVVVRAAREAIGAGLVEYSNPNRSAALDAADPR